MHRPFFMALIASVVLVGPKAIDAQPQPVHPADLEWRQVPGISGLQIAWVLGSVEQASPYQVRVKLASGARIPPHTHPDERNSTVLSGHILVGFGETFDESSMVELGPGSVYVAAAGVSHYVWAKEGEAVYQESGFGPSGTRMAGR